MELEELTVKHALRLHQRADDKQVNISVPVVEIDAAIERLGTCLIDVEVWVGISWFRLIPSNA